LLLLLVFASSKDRNQKIAVFFCAFKNELSKFIPQRFSLKMETVTYLSATFFADRLCYTCNDLPERAHEKSANRVKS